MMIIHVQNAPRRITVMGGKDDSAVHFATTTMKTPAVKIVTAWIFKELLL